MEVKVHLNFYGLSTWTDSTKSGERKISSLIFLSHLHEHLCNIKSTQEPLFSKSLGIKNSSPAFLLLKGRDNKIRPTATSSPATEKQGQKEKGHAYQYHPHQLLWPHNRPLRQAITYYNNKLHFTLFSFFFWYFESKVHGNTNIGNILLLLMNQ